jgi:hypothetical protein
VRGTTLNTTTGGGDKTLNGGCVKSSSEFLLLGFDTRDNRDCE